uniref:Uncharacterized protein n=1 Tax=Opuntia streptacantha TaxID=393608 RepID=A0A7C9AMP0_OPUST
MSVCSACSSFPACPDAAAVADAVAATAAATAATETAAWSWALWTRLSSFFFSLLSFSHLPTVLLPTEAPPPPPPTGVVPPVVGATCIRGRRGCGVLLELRNCAG